MKLAPVTLALAATLAATANAQESPAPVRLDQNKLAGLDLTAIPPDAYQDILVAGELNMRVATLFEGRELRVSIFESTRIIAGSPDAGPSVATILVWRWRTMAVIFFPEIFQSFMREIGQNGKARRT